VVGEDEDHLADLREALGDQGEASTTPCGCEWRRVTNFEYRGVTLSGDLVTRKCTYHSWYGRQPLDVIRQLSRQEQARWLGTKNTA